MLPIKIRNFFKKVEPKLELNDVRLHPTKKYFRDLCESIVCQQLSRKAAASIWKKFKLLVGEKNIRPEYISKLEDTFLRTTGISWAKARYSKSVAQAFLDGTVTSEKFSSMKDEEIIAELIKIKGVGRWTAEMFLMFSLGRVDVFSSGDLGLRKAVQKLYAMKILPSENTMKRVSRRWSPFRTYGALLLWRSLETV